MNGRVSPLAHEEGTGERIRVGGVSGLYLLSSISGVPTVCQARVRLSGGRSAHRTYTANGRDYTC